MRYLLVIFLASCGHGTQLSSTPTGDSTPTCCERLGAALGALKRFERYCIAAAFLEGRYADPKVQSRVKEALGICKYVFGVKQD